MNRIESNWYHIIRNIIHEISSVESLTNNYLLLLILSPLLFSNLYKFLAKLPIFIDNFVDIWSNHIKFDSAQLLNYNKYRKRFVEARERQKWRKIAFCRSQREKPRYFAGRWFDVIYRLSKRTSAAPGTPCPRCQRLRKPVKLLIIRRLKTSQVSEIGGEVE